jgi:PAS domain S-box-containing protein
MGRSLVAVGDPARLKALRQAHLLKTGREEEFDRLTRLAKRSVGVPAAAITLIDETTQHYKSSVGLPAPHRPEGGVPLSHSFCKYVVSTGRSFVVEDVRSHPWLKKKPFVGELEMVAYAGVPIRSEGQVLGALAVFDSSPRRWSKEEVSLLKDLATLVEQEVSRHRWVDGSSFDVRRAAARAALEELLSTSAQFDSLVERSSVGVWVVQQGRVLYANPRCAEIFGFSEADILERQVLELLAEDEDRNVADRLEQAAAGETLPLWITFRGARMDGSVVHVELHGTHLEIEGKPAVAGVLLDVSERESRLDALRRSEERLRLILELAPDAFVAIDEVGTIVEWNAGAQRTFGWARDEVLGRTLADTIVPARHRRIHDRWLRRARSPKGERLLGRRMEMRARSREEREFTIEINVIAVPLGDARIFCAFLHDITPRKLVEEALRRNEEKFRSLVENSWDIIHVLDGDGVIRYISPSVREVLGYDPTEIVGQRCDHFVHPDDVERARNRFSEHIKQADATQSVEMRLRHRDGSWRYVEVRGRVATDSSGERSAVINTHDLTERKQAEEELHRKNSLIDVLRGVAMAANEAQNEREAMQGAIDLICTRTGWGIGHVFVADDSGLLTSAGVWHMEEPEKFERFRALSEKVSFRAGAGLPGRVLEAGEALWIPDVETDPSFTRSRLHDLGIHSAFASPVVAGGRVVAVLEFFREQVTEPDESFRELISGVGNQLGRVIERVRAVEALRQSDERYQLVSRATNDSIWEWDLRAGKLVWNEIAAKVLRYRPEEMGTSIDWWYDRIHADDRERVVGGIHAMMGTTSESWSSEYRFLRGDGSYATVLDRGWVVRDDRGVAARMIGCMLDVSERRQAEEAQRLLGHATGLLSSSLDPRSSLPGFARYVLPALGDFCFIELLDEGELHRSAAAHVEPGMESLLAREHPQPLALEPDESPIARSIRSGEPVMITECTPLWIEQSTPDGPARGLLKQLEPLSLMAIPLVGHAGALGVIVLATSVSGRRYGPMDLLLAEELGRRCTLAMENAHLYREAQDAVRAREEILGVVSHDLRNPLNTIQLAVGMLHEANKERRSEHLQWLDSVNRAVAEMDLMIEDLLDISSIDAGRFSISPASHDAASILRDVAETFEPLAEQKSIELTHRLGPGLSTVWIDPYRIRRVFSNLLGNALKFVPENGKIELRAERREKDVCFSVSDTGPGIPARQLPHVFDRYWQARPGDRRGAGLGLAIARGIVQQHGGEIWVESTPGTGATFSFTVPIRSDPPPSTLSPEAE